MALRLNSYPLHYKAAFACSVILYRHSYQLALQFAFPDGEEYRLTTFRVCTREGEVPPLRRWCNVYESREVSSST